MSATHIVEITCDTPGCGKQHIDEAPASWVRELAAERGWTKVGRSDYCPAHAQRPEQRVIKPADLEHRWATVDEEENGPTA